MIEEEEIEKREAIEETEEEEAEEAEAEEAAEAEAVEEKEEAILKANWKTTGKRAVKKQVQKQSRRIL